LAGALVVQVEEALGSDCPTRHQQGCRLGDHRIGVDDAKIHPGHPTGVQVVLVDRDGGGDGQPELAAIGQQGDRPDLVGWIRDGTSQPHPQRRVALGDGQPHALAVELKRVVVEADRHQKAFAAWESGLRTLASTLGGLEPGV
jgi:hypothetical protein